VGHAGLVRDKSGEIGRLARVVARERLHCSHTNAAAREKKKTMGIREEYESTGGRKRTEVAHPCRGDGAISSWVGSRAIRAEGLHST
jgi:hypothetical protein